MSVPIPLQTAAISAVTAAVVTLMLDVLIRPYLEVRKDRIVSTAKGRRELTISLRVSASKIGGMEASKSMSKESLQRIAARIGDHALKIRSLGYPSRVTYICSKLLFTVSTECAITTIVLEKREKRQEREQINEQDFKADIDEIRWQLARRRTTLADVVDLVRQITSLNAWMIRRRYRFIRKAEAYVTNHADQVSRGGGELPILHSIFIE